MPTKERMTGNRTLDMIKLYPITIARKYPNNCKYLMTQNIKKRLDPNVLLEPPRTDTPNSVRHPITALLTIFWAGKFSAFCGPRNPL